MAQTGHGAHDDNGTRVGQGDQTSGYRELENEWTAFCLLFHDFISLPLLSSVPLPDLTSSILPHACHDAVDPEDQRLDFKVHKFGRMMRILCPGSLSRTHEAGARTEDLKAIPIRMYQQTTSTHWEPPVRLSSTEIDPITRFTRTQQTECAPPYAWFDAAAINKSICGLGKEEEECEGKKVDLITRGGGDDERQVFNVRISSQS